MNNRSMPQTTDILDDRLQNVIRLIGVLPLHDAVTILDIGAGQGQIAKYFARIGKKVTCTGLQIKSYVADVNALRESYGIEYVECDIENMPFPDSSFDVVVMSHVLEHCPNVSRALGHVRRVLSENGLLLVIVPPAEDVVCAGHVSVGWNIGQLMYVLLLNGFDVRTGSFIEYGYNVCGFVKKSDQKLPELRFDQGDIADLSKAGLFPLPIAGDFEDSFNGSIKSVNWPNIENFKMGVETSKLKRFVYTLMWYVLPNKFGVALGHFLVKLGRQLVRLSKGNPDRLI